MLGTKAATAWERELTDKAAEQIKEICADVMIRFRYAVDWFLILRNLIGEQIKALNKSPLRGDSQSVQNMKEVSTKIFLRSLLFTILENPGAISRVARNGATKVFKHGLKSS